MCGIAGFAGLDVSRDAGIEVLGSMCSVMIRRGPDDEGIMMDPPVGLGMRRLSIIDLAGGQQPISNEDGSVSVVFNGEIYNHEALRNHLVSQGHRFGSRSDTEVLVHLYEDEGAGLVRRLVGMFGFAIWDRASQQLFLARDRLGIKPLYYYEWEQGVAFASDLRCFCHLPDFRAEVDPVALARYMVFGYVPEPDTILSGVRKLPPGCTLTWSREAGVEVEEYWSPAAIEEIDIREGEAVEELRTLLLDAVRIRMMADVPLGAFLSGGTDSSAVVAAMVKQADDGIRTFSIGFEESEYNEASAAAETATALGTRHTELVLRPDADELIEEVVGASCEPFGDSSAIPTYLVSRLAAQHVKVSLSGDGGDELFAGYTRYAETLTRGTLPGGAVRTALGGIGRRLPHGALGRNRLLDLGRNRRGRYASTVALPLPVEEGGVGRPRIAGLVPPFEQTLDPWFEEVAHRDFLTQMTLVDIRTYLVGDILPKVDRMSMACSLEARVPFLDHRLVEFAVSLPSHLKLRNGQGKWILRKAIADWVPESVMNRPKQGFAVPLGPWFRDELRHRIESLLDPSTSVAEYLDLSALQRLVSEHLRGRRDHSHLLWRILVLRLWLDQIGASAR